MNTESEREHGQTNEHRIELISRSSMEITGIEDVESFSDSSIVAVSSMGVLSVEGEDVRIESFSSQTGRLSVRGKIDGIFYFDDSASKKRRAKSAKAR